MESTQQKPRQRGNSERVPANVYHVQNFGSIDKTFKLTLFLSPMKSVSHCKERNARNLVQLYGPYFDEVAHLLSAMTAMEYLIVRGKSSSRLQKAVGFSVFFVWFAAKEKLTFRFIA